MIILSRARSIVNIVRLDITNLIIISRKIKVLWSGKGEMHLQELASFFIKVFERKHFYQNCRNRSYNFIVFTGYGFIMK